MAVTIRITGDPLHVEQITRDLRHVYRVVVEWDRTVPDNKDHIERELVVATEVEGEYGREAAEGFAGGRKAEGFSAVHDAG